MRHFRQGFGVERDVSPGVGEESGPGGEPGAEGLTTIVSDGPGTRRSWGQRVWHAVGVFLLVASVLGFVGVVGWPQYDLSRECRQAMEHGGSECLDALLGIVMDENVGYRDRNHAVEVLGRLRDVRALLILQGLYTGPEHEPASLDEGLSQALLAATIRRLGGVPTVNPLVEGWGSGATSTGTGSSP